MPDQDDVKRENEKSFARKAAEAIGNSASHLASPALHRFKEIEKAINSISPEDRKLHNQCVKEAVDDLKKEGIVNPNDGGSVGAGDLRQAALYAHKRDQLARKKYYAKKAGLDNKEENTPKEERKEEDQEITKDLENRDVLKDYFDAEKKGPDTLEQFLKDNNDAADFDDYFQQQLQQGNVDVEGLKSTVQTMREVGVLNYDEDRILGKLEGVLENASRYNADVATIQEREQAEAARSLTDHQEQEVTPSTAPGNESWK